MLNKVIFIIACYAALTSYAFAQKALPGQQACMKRNSTEPSQKIIDDCTTFLKQRSKASKSDIAEAHNRRANAYMQINRPDEALADYGEAIRLAINPMHTWGSLQNRAAVYISRREYQKAIDDYTQVIALDPTYSRSFGTRASLYLMVSKVAEAIDDQSAVIKLEPGNAGNYSVRAQMFERADRLKEALRDYQKAASINSNDLGIEKNIKRLQYRLEVRQEAVSETKTNDVPPLPGRRVALVIGNSNYKNAQRLENPANDASDVASMLRGLSFEVIEGFDVTKSAMEERIREFANRVEGAAVATFFYAGHGLQYEGRSYLVPIDAKLDRPSLLSVEAFSADRITDLLDDPKRVNIIILDACRDNPFRNNIVRSMASAGRSASVPQGLAEMKSSAGTLIAFSTNPDNVALDGNGGRNSPYTAALLKHLGRKGLQIEQVFKAVRNDVLDATNRSQIPWESSRLIGDLVLR